jgi:tetratricopeptide (TPR) repeat protein
VSTTDAAAERDPIDVLVETFLRQRRERPALTAAEFARAHPEHERQLLDLLPAIEALEEHKRDRASSGSSRRTASVPQLERLGEFRIVREVGRGGMGVVFEAVQQPLGRKVALKVLPQASLLTGSQLERFRREAQIAAQLHHSNIVPVFGSGESDGYHWYAMQFIAGESLDRWREQQTQAPPAGSGAWRSRARFVARLGVQAASALHYAHGQGTLHRDVKPGNLLLETSEHLWVTDFGLAKALEAEGLTHSGDLLGTLQYMAPEQFAGSYDARSEVYALGVTLYELLTLQPAFTGGSRSELMERIRTQRPAPLRRVCPDVPEDLAVIVEKAFAREPGDRYADANLLQRDLQAFLDDRPVAARRLSPLGVVWRWGRRNRGVAALAASTLLAVVAAGVTGWVAYGITGEALVRERAAQQLAQTNLQLALAGFNDVFDALVGRDPMLALDEDPDTGEQTLRARSTVDPASVPVQQLLAFYQAFAQQNADNRTLRLETARAHRRVGAVLVRLGRTEQLTAARAAFAQALSLLDQVDDRNVARERAAVHVEIGRLELELDDPLAAARSYREALDQLDRDADPEAAAVRFERAQTHLLLARLADIGGGPVGAGGPRAGVPGAAAPPGGPRRGLERWFQTARQHLQQATAIAEALVQEDAARPAKANGRDAGSAERRLLLARCLLVDSRLPDAGEGREGRERRGERDGAPPGERGERPERGDRGDPVARERANAQRDRAIGLLRELVEKLPDDDVVRFELAEALVPNRGRGVPRRPDAPGDPAEDQARAARWREVQMHARRLVAEHPSVSSYQALFARAGVQAARDLRQQAAAAADDAQRATLRRRMLVELEAAVAAAERSLRADGASPPPHVRTAVEARRLLAEGYVDDKRPGDARAQVDALLALLEGQLAVHEASRGARPGAWLGIADGNELQRLETLLQGFADEQVLARARAVRDRARDLLREQRAGRPQRGDDPRPPGPLGPPDRRGR